MNDIFHISKLIIKKKLKILTDSEETQMSRFRKEYPFLRHFEVKRVANRLNDHSTIDVVKAWKRIEAKHGQKLPTATTSDKSTFHFFSSNWIKYAAAILLLGVIAAGYFLSENVIDGTEPGNPVKISNNINIGTDKATLTLGDGSIVVLEKGQVYQTKTTSSNGQKIEYTAKDDVQNSSALAYNFLTVPRGGQFFVKLADGTQVWLNSETQLKYPVQFPKSEARVVELVYGEAYFDVSPSSNHNDAAFMVHNNAQEVEVLGTEFNIKAYKGEDAILTTLVEGKVLVRAEESHKILKPEEQARLNMSDNDFTVTKVDVYNEVSWKEGVFSFHRKPLVEIMEVLSRWYDFDIQFANPDLKNAGFNGVLGKDQDIIEILETIKKFGGINSYEINDKTIVLK